MKVSRFFLVASLCVVMVGITACTSKPTRKDTEYCSGYFDSPGTYKYGKCIQYYNAQSSVFKADFAACGVKADEAYPGLSYDRGNYAGGIVVVSGVSFVQPQVLPDYKHNAEVDAKRFTVTAPCMAARGWHPPAGSQTK